MAAGEKQEVMARHGARCEHVRLKQMHSFWHPGAIEPPAPSTVAQALATEAQLKNQAMADLGVSCT